MRLDTLAGIKENFYMNPKYYPSNYGYVIRFEPLWNTLSYADNGEYKGWYIKCAIVEVDPDSGIRQSYDTIWFDIKPYKDTTKVICQISKHIKFTIDGNIPKVLKGQEKDYTKD